VAEWWATYVPTPKNALAAGFWKAFGFERVAETSEVVTIRVDAATRQRQTVAFITVSAS
jgi:hypothetical protein